MFSFELSQPVIDCRQVPPLGEVRGHRAVYRSGEAPSTRQPTELVELDRVES